MTRAIIRPLRLLLPWGVHHDPRTPTQIDDEIGEELSFHMERLQDEFEREGHAPAEAWRRAAQRFGDIDVITSRCRTVALEDRIMLQRLNMALMVVVILLVAGVGAQMIMNQRASARSMADLATQLALISERSGRSERGEHVIPMPPTEAPAVVYLTGDVEREGTYTIPQHGKLTVRRLIAAAGLEPGDAPVHVIIEGFDQVGERMKKFESFDAFAEAELDPVLQPNDLVRVAGPHIAIEQALETRQNAAVGEFVRTLFMAIDPRVGGDPAALRSVLDSAAAEAERKHADDPLTLGMIRELIAARRRLLDIAESNAPVVDGPNSNDESLSMEMRSMLRVRELAQAIMVAAAQGDGRLPVSLEALVTSGAIKAEQLQSPSGRASDGGADYLYAAAGLDPAAVTEWSRRITLIDRTLMLQGGKVAVAFLDGHVETMTAAQLDERLHEPINADVQAIVARRQHP